MAIEEDDVAVAPDDLVVQAIGQAPAPVAKLSSFELELKDKITVASIKDVTAALSAPEDGALQAARTAYDGVHDRARGEVDGDPYLTRAWPNFDALAQAGFSGWLQPYRDLLGLLRVDRS